jgi:hypothetical protein
VYRATVSRRVVAKGGIGYGYVATAYRTTRVVNESGVGYGYIRSGAHATTRTTYVREHQTLGCHYRPVLHGHPLQSNRTATAETGEIQHLVSSSAIKYHLVTGGAIRSLQRQGVTLVGQESECRAAGSVGACSQHDHVILTIGSSSQQGRT